MPLTVPTSRHSTSPRVPFSSMGRLHRMSERPYATLLPSPAMKLRSARSSPAANRQKIGTSMRIIFKLRPAMVFPPIPGPLRAHPAPLMNHHLVAEDAARLADTRSHGPRAVSLVTSGNATSFKTQYRARQQQTLALHWENGKKARGTSRATVLLCPSCQQLWNFRL